MKICKEPEFREIFYSKLSELDVEKYDYVTGPGRSGAVAAVYASHYLGIPFVPYKLKLNEKVALIVDTAKMSGRTLRRASRRYDEADTVFAIDESKDKVHIRFWYEEISVSRGRGNEFKKVS